MPNLSPGEKGAEPASPAPTASSQLVDVTAGEAIRGVKPGKAPQHVDAAGEAVVGDVPLLADAHGDSVHDFTRAPGPVLAHVFQIRRDKGEGVLVEEQR